MRGGGRAPGLLRRYRCRRRRRRGRRRDSGCRFLPASIPARCRCRRCGGRGSRASSAGFRQGINTFRAHKHGASVFMRTNRVYAWGRARPWVAPALPVSASPQWVAPRFPDASFSRHPSRRSAGVGGVAFAGCRASSARSRRGINTFRAQKHGESVFMRTNRVYAWGGRAPGPHRRRRCRSRRHEWRRDSGCRFLPASIPARQRCRRCGGRGSRATSAGSRRAINTFCAQKHGEGVFTRTNRVYAWVRPPGAACA